MKFTWIIAAHFTEPFVYDLAIILGWRDGGHDHALAICLLSGTIIVFLGATRCAKVNAKASASSGENPIRS